MKIVGYYVTREIVVNSDGEYFSDLTKPTDYLEFLTQNKGECIKVLLHLNYAASCLCNILKLDEKKCEILHDKGQISLESGQLIRYRPAKHLGIKYGSQYKYPYNSFSDMSQYHEWTVKESETLEECINNAKLARDIGEQIYNSAKKLNLSPKTLTSPIRIFESEVLGKYDSKGNIKPRGIDIPTINDLPDARDLSGADYLDEERAEDITTYSYECCHGGWNEAFKKGNYEQSWDYDINSAYPYYLMNLRDTRYGDWFYTREFVPDMIYGFYYGTLNMKAPFHPILYSVSRDMSYTPVGKRECYLQQQEIEFIRKYKLGTFKVEDGYCWEMKKDIRPLFTIIKWLWNVKNSTDGLEKEFAKRVANGMWGKFGEVRGEELGDHFFSPWHAWVECQTRLEVARFVIENELQDDVLSIAVDGVLTAKPAKIESSKEIGEWRLASNCPAIVLSSGVVAVRDKHGVGEFSLDYDRLIDMIKANPEASEYEMKQIVPMTLGKALNEHRIDELGSLVEIKRNINVTGDTSDKRLYTEFPKCGQDLLDNVYSSMPISLSFLESFDYLKSEV